MSAEATPKSGASRWIDRRVPFLVLSAALYLAACLLPALLFHTGSNGYGKAGPTFRGTGYESVGGAALLFTGVFGIVQGNFAVLANPALWLSWLFFVLRLDRGAIICSTAALLLAMCTFQLVFQQYYFDEGGVRGGYLKYPEIGFYLWLASMTLILFLSIRARRKVSARSGGGLAS